MAPQPQTATILFTDLVGSTELLQRTGDDRAQHIFKAHHRLLSETVEAHGGTEVKWLGDGLMAAFGSSLEAVKCAIAMQQSFRRPTAGVRLEVRAGINVGEVVFEDGDYFGSPVVIARRLCDTATSGQILVSDLVARLIDGRAADFQIKELGPLDLKGIAQAVAAIEILYEHDPMELLRVLPFVGRNAEFETMTKRLDDARRGTGSVLLLAGEPGIGKTRLTEEVCLQAAGARIIRGNCYEGEGAAPFGPWVEALRSLLDQTPDQGLSEALGSGAADLAIILPEVRRRMPGLAGAPRLEPELERVRLFDSIVAWLRNAAAASPLIIFLDDLHWCDKPSLALLEQVARNVATQSLVIVCTYRDVEVDRVHPLAPTLAALRRIERCERIAVRGFGIDAVRELLWAIEPAEPAGEMMRALADLLYKETEGSPYFLREVLNNLVESGKLVQQDGVWTGSVASIEEMGIPEGVREITGRRLSRLSDACNRMLQNASAMTSGFTWDELCAICAEPEDSLLDALDEALASQLIAEDNRHVYAFTHSLIRATLYEELSTPRRVLLHRRTAEALEALYAGDIEDHLGELASHYIASMGGDAEKAIVYSIRAGDRAQELLAWEEAAAHYERALDAMDVAKKPRDEERCRLLRALVRCNRVALRDAESIALLQTMITIARRIPSAELVAQGAIAFEEAAERLEDDLSAERLALLEEALSLLPESDSELRAETLCYWVRASAAAANVRRGVSAAGFFAWAGEKETEVLARAREAVAMAERVGNDIVTARAIRILHDYGWTPDNDSERLALIDRGLAAARRAGSVFLEGELLNARAMDLLALGDMPQFRENASLYESVVDQLRARGGYVLPMQVGLHIVEGELETAQRELDDYAAQQAGDVSLLFTSIGQQYGLRHMQGRLAEVDGMWRAFVERLPGLPLFPAVLAWIAASTGTRDDAAVELARLTGANFAAIPKDFAWKTTVCLLAEAAAEIGDVEAAQQLYEALAPYAATPTAIAQILPLGSTARVAGRLAALLGRWDDAEHHFQTALEANSVLGFHAWSAWTQFDYAAMLLRRASSTDHDRGRGLLTQAHAFATKSGMSKIVADCERLLAEAAS
jgi:class 3 adenylate cyclase/tetratricopeptide (TPR) repeat protein